MDPIHTGVNEKCHKAEYTVCHFTTVLWSS